MLECSEKEAGNQRTSQSEAGVGGMKGRRRERERRRGGRCCSSQTTWGILKAVETSKQISGGAEMGDGK